MPAPKPRWSPSAADAVNPMFEIEADDFCPVRTDLAWFNRGAPLFATVWGERWPVARWY